MSRIGETFPYQPGQLNQDGQRAWGPLERAVLTAIIECVQQTVTVDGLDINGNLDFQGNGIVNAAFVRMVIDGDTGDIRQQYVDSNGDLWFRDGQNREVQVTSGGSLATALSAGGFVGDYIATNPNGASYTNSSGEFSFSAPSPSGQSAAVKGGPFRVRQGTSTNYVGLVSPTLAGTYNLTLPTSLPTNGGPTLLRIDATGSMQCAASASFTRSIDISNAISADGTSTALGYGILGWNWSSPTAPALHLGINYEVGDRIDSVTIGLNHTTGATTTASLYHRDSFGHLAILARLCVNNTGTFEATLQTGAPTLTGSFPITPNPTGSLLLVVNGGNTVSITNSRITGVRKLIS